MKKFFTFFLTLGIVGGVAAIVIPEKVRTKSMRDILPLPKMIQDCNGNPVETESLRGKTVAFYFSAQWCIPCKQFTPKLAEFREAHQNDDFEVVLMSLDRDSAQKAAYMKDEKMQWLTAPGQSSKEIDHIMNFYKLPGIPSLIVFEPDGRLVTTTGREDVTTDPVNALSKWRSM